MALIAMLIACGKARPPGADPARSWWCWPESGCFATRGECERAAAAGGVQSSCVPRPTAYCASGCSTPQPGARPICSPMCGVDQPACEMVAATPSGCVATPPPLHPELYPRFTDRGFWCWALTGPTGITASECVKHQEHCEYELASTLGKLGLAAGSAKCTRPAAKPICFSWKIDDALDFICTLDRLACDGARSVALASEVPAGHTRTAPTECAAYPYD